MVELGEDMVKQCAGLPLAIVVLGGILGTKNSVNDWQMVHENVKSKLRKGRGTWGIHETLSLSYDDLPAYLKPCFLYLSLFPEDYEIPADRLIQLWVAEDIVPLEEREENGEELAEDMAEGYLNELVERYMVLAVERDESFKIKRCRMHDLIRDLCLSKAKQEKFVYIVDCLKTEEADHVNISSSAIGEVRRLVLRDSFMMINRIKNPPLRSLLFFDEINAIEFLTRRRFFNRLLVWVDKHKVAQQISCDDNFLVCCATIFILAFTLHKTRGSMRKICSNFKMLRVLGFEGRESVLFMGCKFLGNISSLFHLRFLSLGQQFCVSSFPASIRNLKCLLTLDLRSRACEGSIHIPDVLWRMVQLRHLYLPYKLSEKTKLKLHKLRNLQTLVNFNTKNCYLEDLFHMKNLRKLEMNAPFFVEKFQDDLNLNKPIIGSKHLRSLCIWGHETVDPRHLTFLLSSCLNICELALFVKIWELPQPQYISSNLDYIRLARSELYQDPMPTLEKLPNLRALILDDLAFIGKVMACSAQGFPRLDFLGIYCQPNLEALKVSEGAMPNLRHLFIAYCAMLKMLPNELRSITTLKELRIESMPKAFKDKLVQGGEDYYKVRHVPSVIFQYCDY